MRSRCLVIAATFTTRTAIESWRVDGVAALLYYVTGDFLFSPGIHQTNYKHITANSAKTTPCKMTLSGRSECPNKTPRFSNIFVPESQLQRLQTVEGRNMWSFRKRKRSSPGRSLQNTEKRLVQTIGAHRNNSE
ncbi:hypothetical protein GEV33_004386 [Tenebrio molitor]|uniref:Uncharacterized protein n=1 Tax=Tenebrio molitor TaxID=7067 RepID=A0A8J6LEI0_TENMO|nr:hypothetical protein GEV33_004386 [Tenebrio molitor]